MMPKQVDKRKAVELESDVSDDVKIIKVSKTSSDDPMLSQIGKLRIVSFNVAGIRAWAKKGGFQFLNKDSPDIACLQETKCTKQKLPLESNLVGYHAYWLSGKKEGYCGIGFYSKVKPINVTYGIGDKSQDDEARMITAEYEKFFLINTYVPNSGTKLVTLPKRMDWDKLLREYMCKLDKEKPVILCGDLNVAHNEIDLKNPKSNVRNAGFTKEERDNFSALLQSGNGFCDTFRHFYPDKTDAYTFWTYMANARSKNVGWRLDYFVVSKRMLPCIEDSTIMKDVMGSDHCPICLSFNPEAI